VVSIKAEELDDLSLASMLKLENEDE